MKKGYFIKMLPVCLATLLVLPCGCEPAAVDVRDDGVWEAYYQPVDEVVYDQQADGLIAAGQLLLLCAEETDKRQVEQAVGKYGGEVVGFVESAGLYQAEFGGDIHGIKEDLKSEDGILSVDYNYGMGESAEPSDDAWQANVYSFRLNNPADPQAADKSVIRCIVDEYGLTKADERFYTPAMAQAAFEEMAAGIFSDYGYEVYPLYDTPGSYTADYGYMPREVDFTLPIRAAHVDLGWELAKSMEPVKLGIVETGFEFKNEDLDPIVLNRRDNGAATVHGTHVAGIACATHDNGKGVAGVGVNAELYLYEIGTFMSAAAGVDKMLREGVKVINVSMGLSIGRVMPPLMTNALGRTIKTYDGMGKEFIVVLAAGNQGKSAEKYVACVPDCYTEDHILIVGNALVARCDGEIIFSCADNSNYGEVVDLFAPGTNILSCVGKNGYRTMSGTSMAAPFAAGIVSMIWGLDPSLSSAQVKALVKSGEPSLMDREGRAYPVADMKAVLTEMGIELPRQTDAAAPALARDFIDAQFSLDEHMWLVDLAGGMEELEDMCEHQGGLGLVFMDVYYNDEAFIVEGMGVDAWGFDPTEDTKQSSGTFYDRAMNEFAEHFPQQLFRMMPGTITYASVQVGEDGGQRLAQGVSYVSYTAECDGGWLDKDAGADAFEAVFSPFVDAGSLNSDTLIVQQVREGQYSLRTEGTLQGCKVHIHCTYSDDGPLATTITYVFEK